MAYLDKDGIPRVAEDIQRNNDRVEEIINNLNDIQRQLTYAFDKTPNDIWKNDAKIADNLYRCNILLDELKERCHAYYEFG